jgi:hypothetical protein
MTVVAGPPGSGKSSRFPLSSFHIDWFNADDRAAELNFGSFHKIPAEIRAKVNTSAAIVRGCPLGQRLLRWAYPKSRGSNLHGGHGIRFSRRFTLASGQVILDLGCGVGDQGRSRGTLTRVRCDHGDDTIMPSTTLNWAGRMQGDSVGASVRSRCNSHLFAKSPNASVRDWLWVRGIDFQPHCQLERPSSIQCHRKITCGLHLWYFRFTGLMTY